MKRWRWTGIVILLMVAAACQNSDGDTVSEPEKINGVSARDVPVIIKEARAQRDGKTLDQFIVEEDKEVLGDFFDLNKGPHGPKKDYKIDSQYRLTEYRANDNLYYYLLEYPGEQGVEKGYFKVIHTKDGWKTFNHYDKPEWEYEIQDLEPHVIKGVHD